jgi:CheY-like chemotaxis protein
MKARSEQSVLVVDDNPAHRYATVRVLTVAGYNVLEAWNAGEAMQQAPSSDLVLLDLCLPDLDGREICRQLRADPLTASTPIVHYSCIYDSETDRRECQLSGSNLFLSSPIAPDVLVDVVSSLLTKAELAKQQTAH